jgi:transcriptional regulator with XRE-family HTH domain
VLRRAGGSKLVEGMMERKGSRAKPAKMVDQRIGPALRAARLREGRSLEEIAEWCGVRRDQIARIEKGRCEVSFPLLLRLAEVLDLDPYYFTSYQEISIQIERSLRTALRRVAMPAEAVAALVKLSVEAQGALVDGLRWLVLERDGRPFRENDVVHQILDHGVAASLDYILAGVAEFGVDADDLWRLIAQMEELPGERCVISDRFLTVTTMNGGQIDPLAIFRDSLQREPRSADVIRLRAKAIGSAVTQSVEQHESRTIYSLAAICSYIDTGRWADGVIIDSALIEQHVAALVQALRTTPNYRIGFLDDSLPFNLLVKANRQALVYAPAHTGLFTDQSRGVAFRYSRADVAWRFREYFDDIWERIPAENKDSNLIADWLEQRMMARR